MSSRLMRIALLSAAISGAALPALLVTRAALARQPGDWKTAEGGSGEEAPPLTEEEQVRYDKIARLLLKHINEGNAEAYRAMFTDDGWETSIDWWQNMFKHQRARFGPIVKAYRPSRGIVHLPGGMGIGPAKGCAGIVVQFEDPAGGLLSFRLDEHDKIVETSA